MKQQTLFDIPKDRPSLAAKIVAFKREHDIWTVRAAHLAKEEGRWTAFKAPDYIEDKKAPPMEIIAGYCRLLEESGHLVDDMGELTAIRQLCANLKIPCDL